MRKLAQLSVMLWLVSLGICAHAGQITFQAWSYAMPGEEEYCKRLAADFEAANPGDKVNLQFGSWEGAHEQMGQWLRGGTGADLMVVSDMWLTEFAPYTVPYVDDLPAAQKAEFFDVLLNKATYKGHGYGLVWATSTKALFYRTDLLRAQKTGAVQIQVGGGRTISAQGLGLPPVPPKTWDDVRAWGGVIQDPFIPAGPYALGIPVKPTYESTDNWYFFFWSAGGEFFDARGKAAVNSPIGVSALNYYCNLARVQRMTQPEVTSWSRKDLERFFAQGQVAMHANGPWLVATIKALNPRLPYAIAPLPMAPNDAPFRPRRVTQVITDHLMMNKACREPELARRFIDFAYQDRYRQEFCQLGMVPEKKSVANSAFFQRDPHWKIFVDILPDGKFLPLMNWEPIEQAMQQMLWKVFSGRQEAQAALDELAAEMDRVAAEER